MSEEATPAAAPAAAPSPAPSASASPAPAASPAAPAPTGGTPAASGSPSAQESGNAVADAMDAQGVTDPNELDWSRNVKVTVDGQERTVPLSELRGNYELRRGSMARFEEAKRLRESAEGEKKRLTEIMGALKDPAMAPYVLRELGYEPDQLRAVQEALRTELEMPEDQRRMRDLERREKEIEERERAFKSQRAREQAAKDQAVFTRVFNSALEPHGLSGDPTAIRTMAAYLDHQYPRQPGARLTEPQIAKMATEAASYAAEQMETRRRQAVASLDPGTLAKLLTPEQAQALREQRVEEYRQGKAQPPASSKPKAPPADAPRQRMHSLADFKKVIEGG